MAVNQLKAGAIISYANIFITNIVGLLITPYIITSLGKAEYGLYTMIGALVGQMTVLDFGLNNTIVRFVAKYRAEKDKKGEENFLAHSFLLYFGIAIAITIAGIFIYFNLDTFYNATLTASELQKAKVMAIILIFNLAITLPGGAFLGICNGYEEFVLPKLAGIVKYIIRSALVVGLLYYGGDSIGLVILDTLVNLVIVVVHILIVFRKLKVRIHFYGLDKKLIRTMLSFSIWIFVFAMVNQLRWPFGQAILGHFYEPSMIAIYAVGITLGNYYGAFSSAISSLFLPRAMQMITAVASHKELTDTFIKISRLILIILLYVFGGFILVGREFIFFWVGPEYYEAYRYVIYIMFGLTFILSQSFANDLLQARNMLSFRGILLLILTIIGVLAGTLLSQYYGMIGMIIGTVFFMLLERVIMWKYYSEKLGLQMMRYFKEISSLFLVSIVITGCCYYIKSFVPSQGIINFIFNAGYYSVFYFLMIYFVLTSYEKSLIRAMLPKKNQHNTNGGY